MISRIRSPGYKRFCILVLGLLLLGACSPAAQPIGPSNEGEAPAAEVTEVVQEVGEAVVETQIVEVQVTPAPETTEAPAAEEPSAPTSIIPALPTSPADESPASTPPPEEHLVELEWPARMRLGDSDVIRLSLLPQADGYVLQADFPEHQIDTQSVYVPRQGGYDLWALARLDGVNFEISPAGEHPRYLPPGEPVSWVWSLRPTAAGQQRLSVVLMLRWEPVGASSAAKRETTIYARGLDVRVLSFFGLSRSQAMTGGFGGLFLGGGLCLAALVSLIGPGRRVEAIAEIQELTPNPDLQVEPDPHIRLSAVNRQLLQALFRRYSRLVVETEFLSGYSGARTFLALPILPDGRADAYTIVKIGERGAIHGEYENYERFVKDTLPPVTARIQSPPVMVASRSRRAQAAFQPAAVRYTFLAEPGHMPRSLREVLLEQPDPAWLTKLFETFGPNWWMQRRPYTFRLAQEYDQLLPTWYVLEPAEGSGVPVDGRQPPANLDLQIGETVRLRGFEQVEVRRDGRSLSLKASERPGLPRLRLRWLSTANPNGATGRVVATRATLLNDYTAGMERFGLPDPFEPLESILAEQVRGTRAIVHGDLNLENALVGPGGLVWLIDFATTREGHTLLDFAHLKAEILAHIIAPQIPQDADFIRFIEAGPAYAPLRRLLSTLDGIAARCLFDPADRREFFLAEYLACLGALKFANLDRRQKHLLYLQAASLSARL